LLLQMLNITATAEQIRVSFNSAVQLTHLLAGGNLLQQQQQQRQQLLLNGSFLSSVQPTLGTTFTIVMFCL
jgi:hypothetical protein